LDTVFVVKKRLSSQYSVLRQIAALGGARHPSQIPSPNSARATYTRLPAACITQKGTLGWRGLGGPRRGARRSVPRHCQALRFDGQPSRTSQVLTSATTGSAPSNTSDRRSRLSHSRPAKHSMPSANSSGGRVMKSLD
jgi:hypothetical protein